MRASRIQPIGSRALRAASALLAVMAVTSAAACGPRLPRAAADFPAAEVLAVTPGPDGGGTILVESEKAGRASVHVGSDARVLVKRDGRYERATFDALTVGQTVDVWTTGQVAESYPVQAWATTVLVKDAP